VTARSGDHVDHDDLDVLIEMLEHEHAKVTGTLRLFGAACLGMFFLLVLFACGLAYFVFVDPDEAFGAQMFSAVSLLATAVSGAICVSGLYLASHQCQRSLERALFCARRGRPKLVVSFVRQIECSAKKDRQVWVDLAMSLVT